jgi:hypothetical protein
VVEPAYGRDAGGDLGGSPVAAAEDAEVDPAAPRVREDESGSPEAGRRSSASTAFACSGTTRVLSLVLVFLILPLANARRT